MATRMNLSFMLVISIAYFLSSVLSSEAYDLSLAESPSNESPAGAPIPVIRKIIDDADVDDYLEENDSSSLSPIGAPAASPTYGDSKYGYSDDETNIVDDDDDSEDPISEDDVEPLKQGQERDVPNSFARRLLLKSGINGLTGHLYQQKLYSKLFVFGDSYADTGNNRKSVAGSWKEPYGVTFPGKPSGRYSNGRVLTDYIGKHLGVKSLVAYRWIKYVGEKIRYGINFSYGGTGVFETLIKDPNMTTQIDFFQKLIEDSTFTTHDLQSSFVLVTLSGNDYGAFLAKGGTIHGLPAFIHSVVGQLAKNLGRLRSLGAKKIVVTALQPLGCLPRSTSLNSFQRCNAEENTAVNLHNLLLEQAVTKLNDETKDSTFVIIDLYKSFTTVLEGKANYPGSLNFESPLKPCCMGTSQGFSCGDVNEKGEKMYTVCADPNSTFFWDNVHPTQAGWNAVYNTLRAILP